MKALLPLLVLLFLFNCSHTPPLAWSNPARAEQELDQLNTRLTQAYEAEDIATLDALLADSHVHNNVFGTVLDKDTFLEDIRSGVLQFETYTTPEIRWFIRDDIAIATGRIHAKATRGGKPVPASDFIFTRVYAKDNDKWKVLLFHNTMAKAPPM